MLKAVEYTCTAPPLHNGVFDIHMLSCIVKLCENSLCSLTYKALYLLAFFGFFRLSNLVPIAKSSFDLRKHLCRGDIIFQPHQAIVIVKWTKTLQTLRKGTFIVIPALSDHPLCPVKALHSMMAATPAHKNAPLFITSQGVITQSQVRAHLSKILTCLNLDQRSYSFHTFRRSGATLAYNNNVSIQAIQRHGTWTSDTVHRYIVSDPGKAAMVADSFKALLSKT